jgi:hypothetical protein
MGEFNRAAMVITARLGILLLLATVAPRYAQEQHQEEAKPQQQQSQHPQQTRPQQQSQQHQQQGQQHQTTAPQGQQHQANAPQGQQHQQQQGQHQQQAQHQQSAQPKGAQGQHQAAQRPANGQAGQHRQQVPGQPGQHPASLQPQQTHRPQQAQANRSAPHGQPVPQEQRQAVWQQHRAHNWQAEHRTWQQRGGYNGYRIPQARFDGYFGPGHDFRMSGFSLVIYGGHPRFYCNGFWFSMLDPWPETWSSDWYNNDDVYINYTDGGYYMYNQNYPGIGIAVNVSLN